jgi:hypothetical protein
MAVKHNLLGPRMILGKGLSNTLVLFKKDIKVKHRGEKRVASSSVENVIDICFEGRNEIGSDIPVLCN